MANKILAEIKPLIINLRRKKDTVKNWEIFKSIVFTKIDQICLELDTRWLVSIADTFADYGNDIEKRNAMFISVVANFEKLWATNLLMYDIAKNKDKLYELKRNKIIPLWDGMYSFNINRGDMAPNLFARIALIMKDTPELECIFNMVIKRIVANENTTLGNLSKYHKSLFSPPPKRSAIKILGRKIWLFLKQYKLFF
jgi:hypothetical protein